MRVGFIYNIATEELLRERPEMTLRDSDAIETIEAPFFELELAIAHAGDVQEVIHEP